MQKQCEIIEYMKQNGRINSKDIQRIWSCSQPVAVNYMTHLSKLNIVKVEYVEEIIKGRHFLIKYIKLK